MYSLLQQAQTVITLLRQRIFSIANQLRYGIVLLVVLSLLLVSGTLIYLSFDAQIQQLEVLQQERSKAAASEINAYLDDLQRKLSYLARVPGLTNLSPEIQKRFLEALTRHNSAYETVAILDRRGAAISVISSYNQVTLTNQVAHTSFLRAFKQQEDFVGAVEINPITKLPLVTLAVPIRNQQDEVDGVLLARINLKFLWFFVSKTNIGKTGYVYIIDNRNFLIAKKGIAPETFNLIDISNRPFIHNLTKLNRTQPLTAYRGLQGVEVVGAIARVPSMHWKVVVELPTSEAYAPIRNMLLVMSGALSVTTVVAAGLGIYFARQIVSPLQRLTQAAAQISAGNLNTQVKVTRGNELGLLATTFNEMTAQLRGLIQELRQERNFASAVLDTAGALVFVLDLQGRIVRFNRACEQLTGYSASEVKGRYLWDLFIPPEEAIAVKAIFPELRTKFFPNQYEKHWVSRDGSRRLIAWSNTTLVDPDGSLRYIITTGIDITERQQAELALAKSEQLYRTMARNFPNGAVLLFDRNLRYILAEGQGLAAEGLSKELLAGATLWETLPPKTCVQLEPIYRAALAGNPTVTEVWHGERFYVLHALPVKNELGEIFAGMVMSQDITERKQAEVALRESEEKFASAFRDSPDAIVITTLQDGRFIEANDSFFRLSGYSREEVIGRTTSQLNSWVNPEVRNKVLHLLHEQGAVRNLEVEFRQKTGGVVVGLFSAEVINVGGKQCLISVTNDITERKLIETQLQLAAERDRLLAEIASRIRRSLNLEQILNTTVTEVRQFLQTDRVFIGYLNENGQGNIVAESVAPDYPTLLGRVVSDERCIEETREFFERNRVRVVDDMSQVELCPSSDFYTQHQVKAILGVPIIVGDEFLGVLVAHQCSGVRHWQPLEIDLLEQLATQVAIAIQQAELYQQVQALNTGLERQVEERTAQLQQKMQELQELYKIKDVFLHAFSHDIRTPIVGTSLVLRNLLNNPSDPVPVSRSLLERIVAGCDRQLNLINTLLEAHSSEVQGIILHCQPVQLSQLIAGVVEDLEPVLAKNEATLTNLVNYALPLLNADPTQLRRVFENLLSNALKYNPPGVNITIKATDEVGIIRCTIKDDGVGMSQEQLHSLFQLYVRGSHFRYSTGLGLGLYLCRQIVTAHGGEIGVQSSLGAGATFWFTLPSTAREQ